MVTILLMNHAYISKGVKTDTKAKTDTRAKAKTDTRANTQELIVSIYMYICIYSINNLAKYVH